MSTSTPPGWYADPAGSGGSRWWDGNRWTEHTAPAAPGPPPAVGSGTSPMGTASDAVKGLRWVFVAFMVFALVRLLADGAVFALITVAFVIPLWAVLIPLQRRRNRRASAAAKANGAWWGGSCTAQPPNLGLGQSGRSFFAGWTPTYWRSVARGRLSVYPQHIVFEPRTPGPLKTTLDITPDQIASVAAARYGFGGILEVYFRDGNRRRFGLSAPPKALNSVLQGAGFPVA